MAELTNNRPRCIKPINHGISYLSTGGESLPLTVVVSSLSQEQSWLAWTFSCLTDLRSQHVQTANELMCVACSCFISAVLLTILAMPNQVPKATYLQETSSNLQTLPTQQNGWICCISTGHSIELYTSCHTTGQASGGVVRALFSLSCCTLADVDSQGFTNMGSLVEVPDIISCFAAGTRHCNSTIVF